MEVRTAPSIVEITRTVVAGSFGWQAVGGRNVGHVNMGSFVAVYDCVLSLRSRGRWYLVRCLLLSLWLSDQPPLSLVSAAVVVTVRKIVLSESLL